MNNKANVVSDMGSLDSERCLYLNYVECIYQKSLILLEFQEKGKSAMDSFKEWL